MNWNGRARIVVKAKAYYRENEKKIEKLKIISTASLILGKALNVDLLLVETESRKMDKVNNTLTLEQSERQDPETGRSKISLCV